MGFAWLITMRDLRRRLRDPLGLGLWVGIPFVILLLLSLAFGGEGEVKPQAHLLVADEDGSFVSGLMIGAMGQGPLAELIRVEKIEQNEGRARMNAGEATALLVIPEGFGLAVLEDRPAELELVTNPAQRILPGIVEETLGVFVDATFYVQRLLGEPIRQFRDGPPSGANTFPDETIASFSVLVNRLVERVGTYLFPPVIGVATETVESRSPTLNLGELLFESMFFMSLLFMSGGMSNEPWRERRQGTLRRAAVTPNTITSFLAGKLLSSAALVAIVSAIGLSAGFFFYGIDASRLPLAILWSTFSGALLVTIFTLIQVYATSERMGGILSNMIMFPIMMAGGSFFPFEAMPSWLAAIGRYTPNGWSLARFKEIAGGTAEAGPLLGAFAGLSFMGAIFFFLTVRRVRRAFVQG